MATYEHESYWPQIKELAQAKKYSDIEKMILSLSDPKEQIALLRFAVRSLMFRDWSEKDLTPLIQLGDRAIAIALEINEIDEANIICFNMSSNLAGCWNDGFTRKPEHFEKGLAYADRALEFRQALKKGPIPFSMAYWAKGAHLYFLGDFKKAEENFKFSLKAAIEAAKAENKPTDISKETSYFVLLEYGYIALTQMAQGVSRAEETFNQVIESFEQMKTISEDAKVDAEIGLDQLLFTRTVQKFSE